MTFAGSVSRFNYLGAQPDPVMSINYTGQHPASLMTILIENLGVYESDSAIATVAHAGNSAQTQLSEDLQNSSDSENNLSSSEKQRQYAKARKARKKAQRERARSLPPKPPKPRNLYEWLESKGALQSLDGGRSAIDSSKLTDKEIDRLTAAIATYGIPFSITSGEVA